MICVRVRCKNCNGWSAWSDRGYVLKRGGDAQWEDEVYVWLFHHSLEQYYGVMTQFGVKSVSDVMELDANTIGSGSGGVQ